MQASVAIQSSRICPALDPIANAIRDLLPINRTSPSTCRMIDMRTSKYSEEQIIGFLRQAEADIQHSLIEPGSPTQNACIESFNGTFRDECLDENWFESLE